MIVMILRCRRLRPALDLAGWYAILMNPSCSLSNPLSCCAFGRAIKTPRISSRGTSDDNVDALFSFLLHRASGRTSADIRLVTLHLL